MTMTLAESLTAAGKPVKAIALPGGGSILVLPHGGRIIGLFSAGSADNFYWTNPALATPESARAFYESGEWQNSGGDRTWLAPEADFFFPEFPNLAKYWQPRGLDPGDYQALETAGGLRLINRFRAEPSRSKAALEIVVSKTITPAADPLRYERDLRLAPGLAYAGYTLLSSLDVVGAAAPDFPPVGLWNLLQMPHGGELLVPTHSRTEPKLLFGSISQEDLAAGDHLVRWRMRAAGDHKIAIRAVATTGRAGYLYGGGGTWALVVRNFLVDPSGEYVDVPWTDTEDFGYSVQACNINSTMGRFSELEYHVPAVGRGTGRIRCEDVSRVWAFRGPRDSVLAVARRLLSPEVAMDS
jgi:hypothetical protein